MNKVTFNFDLLAGLEPGTEEFGKANLKAVMEFAIETMEEVCWLAAKAHDMGKIDTPVVNHKDLAVHIGCELNEQSVWHGQLWLESVAQIFPAVVDRWTSNQFNYITSEGGLWVDMAEVKEAYEAQKQEATA